MAGQGTRVLLWLSCVYVEDTRMERGVLGSGDVFYCVDVHGRDAGKYRQCVHSVSYTHLTLPTN